MTQTTCTVYMFDHSGAVASQPFNYHQTPMHFCAIMFRLGCDKRDRLGFDQSTSFDVARCEVLVRTRENSGEGSTKETFYNVSEILFHSATLMGRGVCRLSRKVGHPKSQFVMKDAWVSCDELPGREYEGALLRHAQAAGIVHGIAQLVHFEEVRLSDDPNDFDTILRNRQVDKPTAADRKLERIHTRIVLETYGKPITKFDTRKGLLLAFHDAVLAHRQLHEVAGILHRDISAGNILINPHGLQGNRRFLIDFDHAIRVGDTSSYSTKKRIGTWPFMSPNVLGGEQPHAYLDDLDSFYFVLCRILMKYTGPHSPMKPTDSDEAWRWERKDALRFKWAHFAGAAEDIRMHSWFGSCFRDLITRLWTFFSSRFLDGKNMPPASPGKDYDKFLGYINNASRRWKLRVQQLSITHPLSLAKLHSLPCFQLTHREDVPEI
ncbi:hypothetical protein JB92DRAFT_3016664, partial [Gautieria morchelliformis]